MALSLEEGKAAVTAARAALDAYVKGEKSKAMAWPSRVFSELRGVFVTINRAGGGPEKLRGCIGFPYPVKPLGDAIREATVAAASEDPRFPPVAKDELDHVVVEVSILTKPEVLAVSKPQERQERVRIGVDGLIVSRFGLSGLLLPQVATEFGMDPMEFLSQACLKAGLAPDSWLDDETEVQTFQAEVFEETSPRGKVVSADRRVQR
jgi:uncharacterized protein (TIGR00296 family)